MADDAAEQLVIQCAMCRRTFPSGISIDRVSLESTHILTWVHECPHCGFTAAYGSTDYRCRDE